MSIALSEFWTRLVRSGITDAAGCKRLASAFSQANRGTPPSDSAALARFMIKAGKLTEFQAKALLADQPRELRIASFVIRSDRSSPPLSRWVGAARIDDGRCGLLFRAGAEQLEGETAHWFQTHQAVTTPAVQAFESEPFSRAILIFSPLPDGRCLHDVICDRGSLPSRDACEIGITLAAALVALHDRSLIHGAVRPDRVWIPEQGQPILLRDPSLPPVAPGDVCSPGWLEDVDLPESYAAPEFVGDGQACTQSTDIYSLGCLLFRLVSGRLPFVGESFRDTIAAHGSETPAELADAVARGESGDPLYRVIAYAMAKNPASRFATAGQLASALQATLRLVPKAEKITAPGNTQTAASALPSTLAEKPPKPKPPKVERPGPPKSESGSPSKTSPKKSKARAKGPLADRMPRRKSRPTPPPGPAAATEPPATEPPAIEPPAIEPPAIEPPAIEPPATEPPATESPPAPPVSQQEATPPSRPLRRRRKKKNKAPLVLGALCVVVLMLVIGLAVQDPNPPVAEKKQRPPIPAVIPSVSNRSSRPAANVASLDPPTLQSAAGYELVTDDRLLFVPPYAADSPDAPLELLPPGPAVIVSTRLAAVIRSEIGSELMAALSPELDDILKSVAARAKVSVDTISRCSAAMHPGKGGWPEVSLAIELAQPRSASELIETWQVAASRTPEGATIYAGDAVDGDAYYFPETEDQQIARFAVGSVERISEVAAVEGGAIPLPRTSQALWKGSSDQADLVVLVNPNFLFADGRALLQSSAPELVGPLKAVLQPDVASALLSAHFGEQTYVEMRLAPSGGVSEAAMMQGVRESIQAWPSWAEEFIVDSVPDPSWRLLASRLPSMMRFVVDHMRFGISDGAAVANTYLPAQAVPQLTLATLLAMNTPSGGGTASVGGGARPTQALTVDQLLKREMSVSFDQESLEFAIDAIASAFEQTLPDGLAMPPVRIIGGDLQLMGITQNQQVRDFSKSDLPLREVLTDLVVRANPDKSSTGPKDPKQALIWVVADDPENRGQTAILVTTRQAAENKYELPFEFRPEE